MLYPAHGWNEATAGSVRTLAGIVRFIRQAPGGSPIDCVTNNRGFIMAAALLRKCPLA